MSHLLHLPQVFGNAITGQADDKAQQFADAWMALVAKPHITWHPLCTIAAQQQAQWLAHNDFTEGDPHRGMNGSYANERLARTGYKLPAWWNLQSNYVESAIRAWSDPAQAAHDLAHHDTHQDHMLMPGWYERWGFRHYGVGYAAAQLERKGYFFVCVTAP